MPPTTASPSVSPGTSGVETTTWSFTSLGRELDAVLISVGVFMLGGLIMLTFCFCVTQGYILYKRRLLRKRRKERGEYDQDDFSEAILSGQMDFAGEN